MATDDQFYFASISTSTDGTLAVRPPPASMLVFPDSNAFNAGRVGAARLFSLEMALNPADSRALATLSSWSRQT